MFDAGWLGSLLSCQCMEKQEARLLTVIPRPLTRTSREWCDTGTFGEAAAGGEQEIPAKLVSRAPELAERAPPTTHDYLDAETGLGDSEGRNPLGRRHSARDVLAKQSDFADDNRDPNKMKVLHELQKKEEKTKRIRAEVKAQDHDIQKIEAKIADESRWVDAATTTYHKLARTRNAEDQKVQNAKGQLLACQRSVQAKLRELGRLRGKRNENMADLRDLLSHKPMVFRDSSVGEKDPRAKNERHQAQRLGSGINGLLP